MQDKSPDESQKALGEIYLRKFTCDVSFNNHISEYFKRKYK